MNLDDYKAGRFEVQLEYQSFLPSMVDHEWIFSDPALLTLLSEADRAVGELNAFSQLVPNVKLLYRHAFGQGSNTVQPYRRHANQYGRRLFGGGRYCPRSPR